MKTTTTTLPTLTDQATEAAKQVVPVMRDYARELLSWLKEGKDFAVAQAPDIAKQIISWAFAEAVVWCVIAAVTLFFAWQAHARVIWPRFQEACIRHRKDYLDDGQVGWFFAELVLCAFAVGSFYSFWFNVLTAVKVAVAPKVYLLEYLSQLVK